MRQNFPLAAPTPVICRYHGAAVCLCRMRSVGISLHANLVLSTCGVSAAPPHLMMSALAVAVVVAVAVAIAVTVAVTVAVAISNG